MDDRWNWMGRDHAAPDTDRNTEREMEMSWRKKEKEKEKGEMEKEGESLLACPLEQRGWERMGWDGMRCHSRLAD